MGKIIISILSIEYPSNDHSEYYKEWLGDKNPDDELTVDLLFDFALFVSTKLSTTSEEDSERFYCNKDTGYSWFIEDLGNIIYSIEDVIYHLHEDIHKKVENETKELTMEAIASGDGGIELLEAEILLSISYLYGDTPSEPALEDVNESEETNGQRTADTCATEGVLRGRNASGEVRTGTASDAVGMGVEDAE